MECRPDALCTPGTDGHDREVPLRMRPFPGDAESRSPDKQRPCRHASDDDAGENRPGPSGPAHESQRHGCGTSSGYAGEKPIEPSEATGNGKRERAPTSGVHEVRLPDAESRVQHGRLAELRRPTASLRWSACRVKRRTTPRHQRVGIPTRCFARASATTTGMPGRRRCGPETTSPATPSVRCHPDERHGCHRTSRNSLLDPPNRPRGSDIASGSCWQRRRRSSSPWSQPRLPDRPPPPASRSSPSRSRRSECAPGRRAEARTTWRRASPGSRATSARRQFGARAPTVTAARGRPAPGPA